MKRIFLFLLLYLVAVPATWALEYEANMWGTGTAAGKSDVSGCVTLSRLIILDSGLVRLHFYNRHLGGCDSIIYNVTTSPPRQVRGHKRVEKSGQYDRYFSINVTPVTREIVITSDAKNHRGAEERTFRISTVINEALILKQNKENWNWQTNWTGTEATIIANAKKDKSPPKIVVSTPDLQPDKQLFRVDTYQVYVRGTVKDNQAVLAVAVNGKPAGLKEDGSFAARLKLALGRNDIKVEAEDINGNVSEKSFVIVRQEFIPTDILADVDIPPIKSKISNESGLAVVIGIEEYEHMPAATYAYNDAEVVREYLADTLGFSKRNIKLVTNSKATHAEFERLLGLNGWLKRNVQKGKSDVVVYFSGHGIPDAKVNDVGLLPFDVDPNYSAGVYLHRLYDSLSRLGAKSVTVFLDTCFAGQGRESQMLVADARGLKIEFREPTVPRNVNILAAATGRQISGAIKRMEHGAFTYFLLKGLGGAADANQNKTITFGELGEYVQREVKAQAAVDNREQIPQLYGDPNKTLVRY